MPLAAAVICHGGHGTLARALACGAPVVVVPAAGDQAENGARVQWAGVGLTLPGRFLSARTLGWVVQHLLEEPQFKARARELSVWERRNRGPARAADQVEEFAARREHGAALKPA
jgi:UDP:flavonoid glycosyltransferase YjiC (YdhE family)